MKFVFTLGSASELQRTPQNTEASCGLPESIMSFFLQVHVCVCDFLEGQGHVTFQIHGSLLTVMWTDSMFSEALQESSGLLMTEILHEVSTGLRGKQLDRVVPELIDFFCFVPKQTHFLGGGLHLATLRANSWLCG